MANTDLFDSVDFVSSEKTKQVLVYFAIALDCDMPVLESLFFNCWAEVKLLDNVKFSNALRAHLASLYKIDDMLIPALEPDTAQLWHTIVCDGSNFFIGFAFGGPRFVQNSFNLTLQAGKNSLMSLGTRDLTNRPMLWRDHFLDKYIASMVLPLQKEGPQVPLT
jgi:hypothetical protein